MTQSIPSEVKLGQVPAVEISGAVKALEFARKIVVTDQPSYELAAEEVRGVKARFNRLEDARVALKRPVLEAGRTIDAFFDAALQPLRDAERLIKATMDRYADEEERKANEARRLHEEEQRRIRAEAERKARDEKAKAEAEAARQRAEAARLQREADEAARQAREARERGDRVAAEAAERERRTAEEAQRKANERAEKAEDKGEERAAAAMSVAAQAAAKPVPAAETPTADGTTRRSVWKWRMIDFKKLVDAVASGKCPTATVLPDEKVLTRAATSLKGEMSIFYPGVEAYEERGTSIRSR